MKSRWNAKDAAECARGKDPDRGLCAYFSRLLGVEPDLAMHGGGNTSVKGRTAAAWGETREALFVKPSGVALEKMVSEDLVPLDLARLRAVAEQKDLADGAFADTMRLCLLQPSTRSPSVEALMHALAPGKFVCHTHPSAMLALTNRAEGQALVRKALGDDVRIVPYARAGFTLCRAIRETLAAGGRGAALVLMHHGLVTWADDARQAYEATITLATQAEEYLAHARGPRIAVVPGWSAEEARKRYRAIAPTLRGALIAAQARGSALPSRGVLRPLIEERIAAVLAAPGSRAWCATPPPTPDYLVRTRPLPLWLDAPRFDDPAAFRAQVKEALAAYGSEYQAYLKRHGGSADDSLPRIVLLPGVGAVCWGPSEKEAGVLCDVTRQALTVKAAVYESGGTYEALSEDHLYEMEFHPMQRAKVGRAGALPLAGSVAVVTGAAGAIGMGVCQSLLDAGCSVALFDCDKARLASAAQALAAGAPGRVHTEIVDITEQTSVAAGFSGVVGRWGGVDIVVVNAGIAHVAALTALTMDDFRRLERVNVDGTLLTLAEAGRLFERQGSGGDIVLVSTKNVFAPGAGFGAYSATKAAAHQLARIASLELAPLGVRVNMVSPDAVFSHGSVRSGLWATVGPDRMKARGLDEKGLEEYYRSRNLLKARVEASHVGNAVLFFVTRQTPTTGATIPVDGGLPDAAPR